MLPLSNLILKDRRKGHFTLYLYLEYVEEIYQTLLESVKMGTSLSDAARELREMTPLPMNSMLEKETPESALDKRKKRKEMEVKNVPPTTPCE